MAMNLISGAHVRFREMGILTFASCHFNDGLCTGDHVLCVSETWLQALEFSSQNRLKATELWSPTATTQLQTPPPKHRWGRPAEQGTTPGETASPVRAMSSGGLGGVRVHSGVFSAVQWVPVATNHWSYRTLKQPVPITSQ